MRIGRSTQSSNSSEKIPTVRFCDLVARPELYDNKVVRVRASYLANFESAMFYDLKCNDRENYVEPTLACDTDESCKAIRDTISKNLEGDPFGGARVELVMLGLLKRAKSGHRFGGQDGFRLGFAITRIEKTIPIPSNTPMPRGKQ
jgi:hypothetical protein